jgi:uncharacterized protein (TIGR00369 family)
MEFKPHNPTWETRLRSEFTTERYMAFLDARLSRLVPGRAEIELPYRPEVTQQQGYFHAGASSSIADTAGGYAAFTLCPADRLVLTVEFKINLVAPAIGDRLRAIGQVIRPGRTLTICDLKVFAIFGEREVLCATGLQTLIYVDARATG